MLFAADTVVRLKNVSQTPTNTTVVNPAWYFDRKEARSLIKHVFLQSSGPVHSLHDVDVRLQHIHNKLTTCPSHIHKVIHRAIGSLLNAGSAFQRLFQHM